MTQESDGRLGFDEALASVARDGGAAFVAVPVFGDDDDEAAEGARIFILERDGVGSVRLRFIAGPFFANAYAANETLPADEAPASVRELRFMRGDFEDKWLDEQIQTIIQKLVRTAGIATDQMPDYAAAPQQAAGPDAVFPVSFIGKGEKPH